MAKKSPVKTWIIRHSPNNDPKFHIDLMLAGVGRSFKAPLIILIRGCVFLIDIIYVFK